MTSSTSPAFRALPLAIALIAGAGIAFGLTQLMREDPAVNRAAVDPAEVVADSDSPAQATPRAAPVTSRSSPEAIEARRTQKVAEAEEARRADFVSFARAYESQRVDPAWARGKEAELLEANVNDLVQGTDAIPKDIDVDCRGTICRIQADFDSRGQGEDWMQLYPLAVGAGMPNLSFEWSQGPDGKPRVIVYGQARQ